MSAVPPPLLELSGIRKTFPGVVALRDARLEVGAGEVHALLGENGAGKSTLIKILAGVHAPDAGVVRMDGRPVRIPSPQAGRRLGIAVIHQELHLVPALTVRENLFLGRERARAGVLRVGEERREAVELLGRLGFDLDPDIPCRELGVAGRQLVEIARALADDARVLVMDEPTAALSEREVGRLLDRVRALRDRGLGIVYVSHRLDEVFALCDRATVLRDGAHVATRPVAGLSRRELIGLMVGRPMESEFPARRATIGPARLEVRDLRRGRVVQGVSFTVGRGEIVGLAGLVGAGRTETARLIFGADRADGGTVRVDGRALRIRSPRDAIRAGICLMTEDRRQQGLVPGRSVRENFGLPNLWRFSRWGFLRGRREAAALDGYVADLGIRLAGVDQPAGELSGGNQQKVILARWLESGAGVVLVDEPTRGVDVGARFEIYESLHRLASAGRAILMISSELPELLGVCDRLLVMRAGQIAGEITDVPRATEADVLALAAH